MRRIFGLLIVLVVAAAPAKTTKNAKPAKKKANAVAKPPAKSGTAGNGAARRMH